MKMSRVETKSTTVVAAIERKSEGSTNGSSSRRRALGEPAISRRSSKSTSTHGAKTRYARKSTAKIGSTVSAEAASRWKNDSV